MKFAELAWGAFIFKYGYSYLYDYQALASDKDFLERLQRNPAIEDFERLRDFLVHYGVPWAPKDLAEQHYSVWPRLQQNIAILSKERLETCDFQRQDIREGIMNIFDVLLHQVWGGETVVSKVMHFFNVALFVMVDSFIIGRFGKYGPQGYIDFLHNMQKEAMELLFDFRQTGLPGRPEEYLSKALKYTGIRPLTKFIDDYNWIAISKRWPKKVPDWLLSLFHLD